MKEIIVTEGGGGAKLTFSVDDAKSPSYQFFYQFGKCASVSDTVLPEALQKGCPGSSGHQTRKDRRAGRFYTECQVNPCEKHLIPKCLQEAEAALSSDLLPYREEMMQ